MTTVAAPVAAEPDDPLQMTVDPADRAVMAEAASAVAGNPPDLARLDAVLAKLPRPTPLRGMVQAARAAVFASKDRVGDAVTAVEEAMRLLPDDPRPKLLAVHILTFAGSPQRAADLWMQASRESPERARLSHHYVMSALTGRLLDLGDRERAERINARLGEIGFATSLAPERSSAALARTYGEVRAKRDDLAIQSVTAIGDPDDLLTLYVDRRYQALWPRIAEWATPTLDGQSRRYLEELRADWTAADDFDTATAYARQLASLGAYPAVVSLFLPMFDRIVPGEYREGTEFLTPVVARSLVKVGRPADARALLDKVAAAMPTNNGGSDLNILAARMMLDANQLGWAATLSRADAFLARAKQLGSSINSSATLQVRAMRACALAGLGRAGEAQEDTAGVLIAEAVMPGPAMQLHLCHRDAAMGRALIVRRLADERTRDWAMRFVQPIKPDAFTPYEKLTEPVAEAIRSAPDVRAAVEKVGRILPQPVLESLPDSFDPFRSRPTAEPLDDSAI
ncbi:hypothetical protein [Sphingomonas rubra]|uniref:hypothetical protein n=1 Tax=Sphingomonas rubra TaxID=634430 RepID=UPI00116050C7|nr:hypothetical protein [Sphingomonas rubra]